MIKEESYARKLSEIKQQLAEASLLIVSKGRPAADIQLYYDLGQRDFGENKVQELEDKSQQLALSCPEIRWHMIGHLQSNKINHLLRVKNLHAIHSVHERQLLDKLLAAQSKLTQPVALFLQFNTSRETEKSGFETYTDLMMAAELLRGAGQFYLKGLMTMGTLRTENFEAEARRCFEELKVLREKLMVEWGGPLLLSMGMSRDYQWALQENSDWIRLGSIMFE